VSAIFGEVLTFGQPGGEDIRLVAFGDEHYARYETLSGYTVVFDGERGRYCHAQLTSGVLRSTGVPAGEPPPPGTVRHLQESPEVVEAKARARRYRRIAATGGHRRAGVVRSFGPNQGLLEGRVLATGTVTGLTVLVEFADVHTTVTAADVEALLNGENYTRNGNICSVREYFLRVSGGKLDYRNVVVGPYRLSRRRQFYVDNLLVEEALDLAVADGVDLRRFDSRGEGIVDALNVLYAGRTQYQGDLWPHNWNITLRHGEVRTDLYLLTSLGRSAADLSIGTFCHESGHLLCRFPDMYDYGQRDGDELPSAGIGSYCLMGSGNHLDFGRSPAPVSAYLRDLAGWCDTEIDLSVPGEYRAEHGDYGAVMKYRTAKPNEYFLVENRSKAGLDRGSPASGLAVYHCDVLGSNELQQGTASQHYQCALLQADGRRDLELDANQGDGSDLFGAIAGVALSAQTTPHSREWDGRDSGLVIRDVSGPGETITFRTGAPTPSGSTITADAAVDQPIPDNRAAGVTSTMTTTGSGVVGRIVVTVDITHPCRKDLKVTLTAPTGRRAVLHARLGGDQDDLVTIYDSASPGMLTDMIGQPVQGSWMLTVADLERADTGRFNRWRLELSAAPTG
jgi:M6 family metalloprotease-like protein